MPKTGEIIIRYPRHISTTNLGAAEKIWNHRVRSAGVKVNSIVRARMLSRTELMIRVDCPEAPQSLFDRVEAIKKTLVAELNFWPTQELFDTMNEGVCAMHKGETVKPALYEKGLVFLLADEPEQDVHTVPIDAGQ